MAIFSVMHVFAFSWKPYDSSRTLGDPFAGAGSALPGAIPKYQGGKLGLKAFADAFNPWDIIKASARGFRWLFVGRRHRFDDSSYANARGASGKSGKIDGALANGTYNGPSYGGSGEAATELRPSVDPGRNRTNGMHPDSDTAGLLSNAQGQGSSPSHMRNDYKYDRRNDEADLGADMHGREPVSPPMPSAYGGFDHAIHPAHRPTGGRMHENFDEDTSYRGATNNAQDIGTAHGGQAGEWDMWGGTQRNNAGGLHPGYSQ